MGKLEGKVAPVTGGNSGIGLAAAKEFVNEGAYLFITGRRDPELAAAVNEIGRNVTGVQGDVSNLGDLDLLFAQIRREKGHLDIVFANAGGAKFAPLGEITEEHFDSIFNINVKGVLSTVQKALPLLPDGASIIVNAVSPGFTDTPAWHATEAGEQHLKRMSDVIPLGRPATTDEIANTVVFLASDDSGYVTGAELFVDGGFAQV